MTVIGIIGMIGIMKAMKNFSLDVENIVRLQEIAKKKTDGNLSSCLDLLIEEAYVAHREAITERLMASRRAAGEV